MEVNAKIYELNVQKDGFIFKNNRVAKEHEKIDKKYVSLLTEKEKDYNDILPYNGDKFEIVKFFDSIAEKYHEDIKERGRRGDIP